MGWRNRLIGAGFGVLGATGVHRLAAPLTRGCGAILTFHHVRPDRGRAFAPNKLLEVTPKFLDDTIRRLRQLDYDIVTLDAALQRLTARVVPARRFAVLSFDDGFRDVAEWALPVLERHGAPGIFYVAPGFADRTARLWWVELEEAIRRTDRVRVTIGEEVIDLHSATPQDKALAFATLYWRLRRGSEEHLLEVIGGLSGKQGIVGRDLVEELCLDWTGVSALAEHPLVTIGAHTLSHAMLAKHGADRVRAELVGGKRILEEHLGRPVRHLAYPVGDRSSAGQREFALASEAGYASAVTTRPGLIFAGHRHHLTALPRVSVNGNHQSVASLDVLLSGVAFTLWNRGRRLVHE
jgi:peptidoglycan/xylan/chitin deacetylase (PgdA/CDA1 family)